MPVKIEHNMNVLCFCCKIIMYLCYCILYKMGMIKCKQVVAGIDRDQNKSMVHIERMNDTYYNNIYSFIQFYSPY